LLLLANTKKHDLTAEISIEMNKNTFIDNESLNNYKMFNTKDQDIRMQSIIFVIMRKPNNKTEVLLTKK